MGAFSYLFGVLLGGGGAGIFYYGLTRRHKYTLIQDTPTSKIRALAMGLVEVQGTILGDKTIEAPFSKTKCVYYKYIVKEYRQHTSKDSKGATHTSYNWDDVNSGEQSLPFSLRDDSGSVPIDSKGAEFDLPVKKMFYQKSGVGLMSFIGSLLKGAKPDPAELMPIESEKGIIANVGDRKYFEYFLEPNENIFIMGTAALDASNKNVIKRGDQDKTFIITTKSEKELIKGLKMQALGLLIVGLIVFAAGIALFAFHPF